MPTPTLERDLPIWQRLLIFTGSLSMINTGLGWLGVIGGWQGNSGIVAKVGGVFLVAGGLSLLWRSSKILLVKYQGRSS